MCSDNEGITTHVDKPDDRDDRKAPPIELDNELDGKLVHLVALILLRVFKFDSTTSQRAGSGRWPRQHSPKI